MRCYMGAAPERSAAAASPGSELGWAASVAPPFSGGVRWDGGPAGGVAARALLGFGEGVSSGAVAGSNCWLASVDGVPLRGSLLRGVCREREVELASTIRNYQTCNARRVQNLVVQATTVPYYVHVLCVHASEESTKPDT